MREGVREGVRERQRRAESPDARRLPATADVLAQGDLLTVPARPLTCCGLDEVGRGALAGPLVAAAVILPEDFAGRLGPLARFLRDSKTVPARRREEVAAVIHAEALAVEVVEIPVAEINARGIGWANGEAFRRLIAALWADDYVVDGRVRPPAPPERAARVRCLIQADARVPAVSAASLVAKVRRDALMRTLHVTYPAYAWDRNAGYGTAAHLAALREHGPCPHHRTAFVATVMSGGRRARTSCARPAPLLATLRDDGL